MIYIYNRDEEQVASLDVIPEFTQEIGKLNTLTFDSDIEFDKGFRVVFIKNKKAYEFIIVDSDYVRNDIYSFSYFCQDALLEIDGNPIIDKRPEGNFKQALEVALEGTRFEIVVMPDYDMGIIYKNHFYRESSFKAFAEVIEKYMLEWWTEYEYSGSKIIKRKLIIGKRGRRVNGRLEFEKNIIEFNRKIISENVVTALFGFGKGVEVVDEDGEPTGGYGRRLDFSNINNGKMYVENLQAKEIYGIGEKGNKQHVYGFVIFEDVEDINLLLELTKKQLEVSSQPQGEYTVNASNVGVGCDIGDEIATVDNKINYRNYSRILKVIEVGEERTFTFGTRQEGYINESIKTIQGIKKEVDNRIVSVMEYTLKQITDSYFGEDGYNYDLKAGNEYGLPAGLYSFDKPIGESPSKVIYIGAGKMLISNEKDPNGEWIWKTAATADGIVGSSIIAHSITANELAADIGQSLDLSSNTSITLAVKDEVDDYLTNNPVEVKTEKPFYAYADIDSIVIAIDRPDEVNYEPVNASYYFDEDITSLIDEHGLDGWKVSYDVKANAETIEGFSVSTHPVSKYGLQYVQHGNTSNLIQHATTLSYEHYEHLITFRDRALVKTTTLGVFFYNTPFSLKNFILKKVGNITNFSTSWTTQKYQGVYVGYDRPTDPNAYEWVKIQGEDGTSGSDGVGLEGEPTIQYGKSDDESTLPTEWFDSPVLVEGGLISWTRTVLTYTDGTITNIDTPLKVPLDGEQGQEGRGIIDLQTMYGLSSNKDVEPTEWFAIPPEIKGGDWSWTRVEYKFSDGTSEFIYNPIKNADILEVRDDGYLYVNGVKTEKKVQGSDGLTPYVKDGYWWVGNVSLGIKAEGKDGKDASVLFRFSDDKTTMSTINNDQRYLGIYNGTGDPTLASSYFWVDRSDLIDELADRVKVVESDIKINKDSIAQKVSQTTYTADQEKVNEQFNTVTQTFKDITAKFENIGGTNLLKNSKYLTNWQSVDGASITETYNNLVTEWDTGMATLVQTGTGNKNTSRKATLRFEVPKDIAGRLVTFSMYVKNTRTTATETVEVDGALVGASEVINPGEIKRIVIQGYANDVGYIDVYLVAQGVGYLFEGLAFKALLEVGNQLNDWTPHPDEINSGMVQQTEEGLTVGKYGGEVHTSVMYNGLFIQSLLTGEPVAEYTSDGAKTSVLTATDIYSDSIIRRQKNSMDIYVGPSMSGDGSGKDSSNRLDNINRAIDVAMNYAHYVTDYAVINIYVTGTINELVYVNGLSGYGTINLIGETGQRLIGGVFVNSCTAQVSIKNFNVSLDAPDSYNACINYHNCTSGNILDCTLVGQDAGRGVNVTRSYVAIENTQFFDLSSGIIATDFGRVLATDCKGRTTFKYGSATKGGWLGAIGTRPSVPELPALLSADTGVIDDTKLTTYASGTRPSFAPPTFASVTKTFYADLATSNSNGYEWLKGEARQGSYNGKINIGIAKFGSKIKDWLAANGGYQGTVTAVVTAKRNNSSGGGTVSFKITSPYTLTLPAVLRGYSSSATAGPSLTSSITTSTSLTLKTSTTSSSDYAGYTSVSIKISTMKKV